MKPEVVRISDRECYLYVQPASRYLLVQPVDEHDLELLEKEVETIQTLTGQLFTLVAFKIEGWNQELSPREAPPVFGKVPFGNGAKKTLAFITNQLLPDLQERGIDTSHCLLGGYSLAGLFALWTSYQSNMFEGIAAASPSVWFPGWIEYSKERRPLADSVYLSLGDKEEKARNPLMAQVGNAVRKQEELLKGQGVNTILEWNAGNHFIDSEKRMAKGFAWLMNNMKN